MRSLAAFLALICTLPLLAQDKPAPQNLSPILKRAMQAYKSLRYTGTRVVEFKFGPDKRRHTEYVIRDGRNSRVEFPSGSEFAGQVIVETGDKRYHYFPDLKEIHVQPARRDEAFGRVFKLFGRGGRYLRFSSAPGSIVAGMRTEQVVVTGVEGNVVQRVHVDPRSGLILKLELFDRTGVPVGGYEFSQVNLNPAINQRSLGPLFVKGAKLIGARELAIRIAKEGGFLPATIPDGNGLQLEHSRVVDVGGVSVLAQVYSGRRGRVSLFQLKGDVEQSRLRRIARDRGSFNTFSWEFQGRNFVLVGELDPAELQGLAKRLTER